MDVTMNGEDWSLVKGYNNYSYSNLFNLEPLVNIRVPDDFDDFVTISSSQDGSEHTRGEDGAEVPMDLQTEMTTKRKRVQIEAEAGSDSVLRDDADSNDDEDTSRIQIPEDHDRGSLGKHLPKRCSIATRFVANASHCSNSTENFDAFGSHSRPVLDLGEGYRLSIPPTYEQLTESTSLPSMSSIHIDESALKGPLTSGNLQAIVTSDRHKSRPCSSRAQRNANSQKKFPLQVLPPDKKLFEETQVNGERQLGGSDVKVIEKGDGYEVIQRRVQRKPPSTKNPLEIAQEDVEKVAKYWVSIIRKDLPKHFKAFQSYHKKQYNENKKLADACQKEVKGRNAKLVRLMRNAPNRNRKLARDMAAFWRKLDKEQAEVRKKEEKDAVEALKRDEEFREARRHQQRLNFLLTQTELYSHFMQNKPAGEKLPAEDEGPPLVEMADALDDPVLKAEALEAAKKAALEQKERTSLFDDECLKLRQEHALDGEKIDLLNPSSMPVSSSVKQPSLFQGNLKEYQLKGLQWLVSCYEQGLNGILADEMGLGKTIQAMAFLAHLAEEKHIWGPFLVIAPATVTTNWAEELKRFCPHFTVLPYWGQQSQRTLLRKVIHEKHLYRRDSGFHVAITNYQLLVSDEKYLKRVKWQYMVLDEAQAIKSSQSLRWKTLLSFSCRNRLLLTGTPIQNNMGELWALLHFIMPTLFDSHDQFNEWFSKGIEGHAEHGGTLNEHQLNRLHAVLKPFMLRRVKKDVITELTNKREVVVPCTLSSRQQAIYQAVKNKISIADLFAVGRMNEKKALSLMNIVIQLRKVCNHPELFERNEGRTYYYFSALTNPLLAPPFRELEHVYYSGAYNPISVKIPKLLYRDGMPCVLSGSPRGFLDKWVNNLLNIFAAENVFTSRTFGFTRLMNLSPAETSFISRASLLERWQYALCDFCYDYEIDPKVKAVTKMLLLPSISCSSSLKRTLAVGPSSDPFQSLVVCLERRFLSNIQLLRSSRAFMPPVLAPQIHVLCSDSSFAYQRAEELNNPWIKRILVGFGRTSEYSGPSVPPAPHHLIEEVDRSQKALLAPTYQVFGSGPPLQSFDFARTLMDSGKLQALDTLLRRLRAEDHRVLVFAQMTKMLNILEDYMVYRKYKYLRLDGSLAVNDRQDMVKDFQLKSDIFVFLLSTRAGGLGINLTAADTVIFYESDWNPTMDLQAMDRAHRLGQTKEVTVYRLICKGTVEEKILKRANQKNTVQQLVMTGEQFEPDEVVSLLLDDAELEQRLKQHPTNEQAKRRKDGKKVQIDENGEVTLQDVTEANAPATAAAGNKRKSQKKQQTGDDNTRPPKAPKRKDNASAVESTQVQEQKQQPKSRSKSRGKKACNPTATETGS